MSDGVPDVVDWMVGRLNSQKVLYQHEVVDYLFRKKLDQFIVESDRGSLSLSRDLLKKFRDLTPDVIWSRQDLGWRRRTGTDAPGRLQS